MSTWMKAATRSTGSSCVEPCAQPAQRKRRGQAQPICSAHKKARVCGLWAFKGQVVSTVAACAYTEPPGGAPSGPSAGPLTGSLPMGGVEGGANDGRIGVVVVTPLGGGKAPVAGGGSRGRSKLAAGGPPAGPIAAPRCVRESSSISPSTTPPTRMARGGLPSMDSSATPLESPSCLGATTPSNFSRAIKAAEADGLLFSASDAGLGGPSSRRRMSPGTPPSMDTCMVVAGTLVGGASQRRPQYAKLAATAAQMMSAKMRDAMIRPL